MLDHHVYDTIIKTSNLQNWSHWWRHKYSRKLKILNPILSLHYFYELGLWASLFLSYSWPHLFSCPCSNQSGAGIFNILQRKRRTLKRVCLALIYIILMSQVAVPVSPFDQQNVSRWSQGEVSVTLAVSQKLKILKNLKLMV